MKNAIVTGATRGVGRAIAEALSKEGFRVWISARKEEELKEAKQEIEGMAGNEVRIHTIDLSERSSVQQYANMLLDECETFDVLVNNAGTYQPDKLTDEEVKLDLHMNLNFSAPFVLTQALIHRFQEQGRGNIFNVCSVVNRSPRVDAASYTISKFAFWGYHQLLHKTLLPAGVKVTAFFPGSIATSSWEGMDAPFEEFVQPEDIASMVVNILHMKRGTVPSEIDLAAINQDY